MVAKILPYSVFNSDYGNIITSHFAALGQGVHDWRETEPGELWDPKGSNAGEELLGLGPHPGVPCEVSAQAHF